MDDQTPPHYAGSHSNGGARHFGREAAERVRDLRDRAGDLGERAEGLASAARARIDDLVDAIDRTRIPERSWNHPLAAVGIAFGVGFLLAGRSDNRILRTAKSQLRGLLVAGVIAAFREELEGLARDEIGALLRKRRTSEQ